MVGEVGIEPTMFLMCLIYSQVSSPTGHTHPWTSHFLKDTIRTCISVVSSNGALNQLSYIGNNGAYTSFNCCKWLFKMLDIGLEPIRYFYQWIFGAKYEWWPRFALAILQVHCVLPISPIQHINWALRLNYFVVLILYHNLLYLSIGITYRLHFVYITNLTASSTASYRLSLSCLTRHS